MTESEDLTAVVQAIDEAQRLLRAHVELSANAGATVERLDKLLSGQQFTAALERTRLRFLRSSLVSSEDSSTRA